MIAMISFINLTLYSGHDYTDVIENVKLKTRKI